MGARVGQHQLRVLADQVRARPGIAVLDEVKIQSSCTPTGFANPTVIGLDRMELREQPKGGQPGPRQDDGVEVGRLVGTAHRVGLEQVRDRADL